MFLVTNVALLLVGYILDHVISNLPVRRYSNIFKNINTPTLILIMTDAVFFSGISLVDAIFGVYIVQHAYGATVATLGTGAAIYTLGILISEPMLATLYDKDKRGNFAFYGYVLGNLLKAVLRFSYIFISSTKSFYVIYFLLGIAHSVSYPSFSKIFSKHIKHGNESIAWGYKDFLFSIGSMITLFSSGYLALIYGYKFIFILSAIILMCAGVIYPLANRKHLISQE